jgi:Rps23 Pro-64 3,4-dihydroxylase Tpa1-like proline 4-hydroxylase
MELVNKPFPHIIIDDFLDDDLFVAVCEALEDLPIERKEADLFQFDQSEDLSKTEIPALQQLQQKLLELDLSNFDVKSKLIDMFAAFYYDTDHLLPHDDQLDTRKVAYTFYLAAPEAGGKLALIENKKPFDKTHVDVLPNRLVLFKVSPESWHEVEEVQGELPRISISGWFH